MDAPGLGAPLRLCASPVGGSAGEFHTPSPQVGELSGLLYEFAGLFQLSFKQLAPGDQLSCPTHPLGLTIVRGRRYSPTVLDPDLATVAVECEGLRLVHLGLTVEVLLEGAGGDRHGLRSQERTGGGDSGRLELGLGVAKHGGPLIADPHFARLEIPFPCGGVGVVQDAPDSQGCLPVALGYPIRLRLFPGSGPRLDTAVPEQEQHVGHDREQARNQRSRSTIRRGTTELAWSTNPWVALAFINHVLPSTSIVRSVCAGGNF